MLWGNRNAFYYVLDRVTGEFLHATAFAKQPWAEKIDHTGRPVRIPDTFPTKDGTLVYPDVGGAANCWSPTYSPKTELFYLMAFDGAGTYYLGAEVDHKPGLPFLGGFGTTNKFEEFPDSEYVSAVRALDPTTGNWKWEYRVQAKSTSGLVSTAGNLVFGGTVKGNFFALDSRNGTELWRLDLGGRVHAAPMTYMVDGKQYVTIAVGSALFTLGL